MPTIPKSLLRACGRAIAEFSMIREGDKVLLGVSGGKDSLSLLHILQHFQRHAPIRFEIGCITIDPQSEGFDPSPLKEYIASLGVPYFYEPAPIMEMAGAHMNNDSYCAFCSRIKRGVMYTVAQREGYNVLALAQHLDDLAESFLMSAFYGGQLKTMKAHYQAKDYPIRIIRPLVYARESQMASFAQDQQLPVIADSCPACFTMPTKREHTKGLLAEQEANNPRLFGSIKTAILPLMREGLPE